jgi:hypothetical protein
MPDLVIRIPSELGLSEEQVRKLEEGFRNQLADLVKGTPAEGASTKQKVIPQTEVSVAKEFKDMAI